jgi:ABC-2 type transport system permease protein
MSGSLWMMMGITILFVWATQALALFLYSLFPVLGLIISVVSMIGSLGATLSGVTFPVSFMYTPVYVVSYLFPVRHFMEIVQSLQYTDGTLFDYGTSILVLLLFLLLPVGLLSRLKNALTTHSYEAFQ